MRHFIKYDLVPLLSLGAVCAFPCIFLYSRNAAEVPPSSMVPFLVVFLINGLLFLGLTAIFLRNVSRAAFWADLGMLVVINFCLLASQLKPLIPFFRDRYLLGLLALALLLLLVWMLRKKPDMRTACLLVLLAFGGMSLVNFGVQGIPAILQAHQVREFQAPPEGEPPQAPEDRPEDLSQVVFSKPDRPNFYYFLFDEYGGYENLLHYYDYDNGPFLEELRDKGFSLSLSSRNTEAIHSDTLVPNLLNLSYAVGPHEPYRKKAMLRDNCQMFRMFAANGYSINLINHVDYIGPSGTRVLTSHQTRRTISEYLMRNSIYNKSAYLRWLLDQFFTVDYGANYRSSLDNALEVSLSCWQEAQAGPTLTFGYIQCPHSPTMVGPHGEELPYENGWKWTDHSLYLGQTEFINDFLRQLVTNIQENDPQAVIILQSDHGNRYALHMIQLGQWQGYDPHEENPWMQNILNCVYIPGTSLDIEGENGINTLRHVFREVLGADLPPVEPVIDFSDDGADEQG